MRFGCLDQLIAIIFCTVGAFLGNSLRAYLPPYLQPFAGLLGAIVVYLAVVYPIYRGFRLFPMILPRCPCCRSLQPGFEIRHVDWPRVTYKCPACGGEFVIWHNGKPGSQETWEKPVLVLKWPYAFGRYKRMEKPGDEKKKVSQE
jgi:hypothetical protein